MFHDGNQKYRRKKHCYFWQGTTSRPKWYSMVLWDGSSQLVIIKGHESVSCVWRISHALHATGNKHKVTPH